jgi:N-acetylglucosamine-6-phosphate deacetylase
MQQLICADRVLTGHGWLEAGAVGVSAGRVEWVGSAAGAPHAQQRIELGDAILAPGFIDLQVNGGGGVLFNDDRSPQALARIAAAHRHFGTTGFLATLISDTPGATAEAVQATRNALAIGTPGLLGLHLEGPFLAAERRGVHRAEHFREPSDNDIGALCAHGLQHLLITVAPEHIRPAQIQRLCDAGIRLSAGHSAASFEQALAAFAAGLSGVTHLFNAMPSLAGRAPGLLGAALLNRAMWCGLIVDGHHLHPASLQLAVQMKPGRCFLVSDAMSPVGSDIDEFVLDGRKVHVRNGRLETEQGVLAGACLDMSLAVRNCLAQSGLPLDEVLRMASTYPADFLGARERGRIEVGVYADLVQLSPELEAVATWINGEHVVKR